MLGLLLHLALAAPVEPGLTLRVVMSEAVAQNPELAAARLRAERARLAVVSAAGAFSPQLSASVFTDQDGRIYWDGAATQVLPTGGTVGVSLTDDTLGETPGASPTIQLTQPLLDGTLGLVGVREASRSAADEALVARAALEALVLSVSDAYWGLVAARESRAYAEQSALVAEDQVRTTRERFEEGFVGSGDLLQVQRALGVARQAAVVAGSDEEAAEMALARLLGRPLSPRPSLQLTERPEAPAEMPDRDAALAAARRSNTAWLRAALARDAARYELLQARIAALPTLNASAAWYGAAISGPAEPPGWALGLSLAVPLVPVSPIAELRRATLSWEMAELAWTSAEQDLVLSVEAAVRGVLRDRLRLQLAVETFDAAQAGLSADQDLLREGRGSARDVVRSFESLNVAQVDRLRTEIALQSSMLVLEQVKGTLLQKLGLEEGS